MTTLADAKGLLAKLQPMELRGTVTRVQGLTLHVADLALPVGAMVRIEARPEPVPGEVVGFANEEALVMPLAETAGIRRGNRVVGTESAPLARVGQDMLGRVVDAMGRPIDGGGPLREHIPRPLRPDPIQPMQRIPIDQPLGTGIRAVDAMLPAGRGQRLGIFSGPGVGKSTLLAMLARQTDADVCVIGMVGERGREVRDFVDRTLGPEGLARSVVVAATADEPALLRIRSALMAHSVAEYFRDQGLDVMLVMDSVTRFAQAQRQVGLAAGEPPTTRGYTPSVFAQLPALLERSGRTQTGSITGFYAILVEGDELTEPISDACRGTLDGHVVLTRELADRGHWPAIDVLQSVSRVADRVTDRQHQACRQEVSRTLAAWRDVEDLVNVGAYAPGSNPDYDVAIQMREPIGELLRQRPDEPADFQQTARQLQQLALRIGQQRQQTQGEGAGG